MTHTDCPAFCAAALWVTITYIAMFCFAQSHGFGFYMLFGSESSAVLDHGEVTTVSEEYVPLLTVAW